MVAETKLGEFRGKRTQHITTLLIWVMSNNEETFTKYGSALSFKGWTGFGLAEGGGEKGFTDKGTLRINAKGHY